MHNKLIIIFLFILASAISYGGSKSDDSPDGYSAAHDFGGSHLAVADFVKASRWADSVLNDLSIDQRIGQLIMLRAHTNRSVSYRLNVARQVKKYHIGGICFFQGGPLRQAHWADHYQQIAPIPLLVAIDGEWGLGMRLDSTLSYPFQMTLGAVRDDYLIRVMGEAIGKELRATGVNMNFAPVMDVNNNPDNPVINFRSFGENPQSVYLKAINYASGLQSQGVLACGKHFPGHGDTDQDSHHTLPIINSPIKEMQDIHLYPFRMAAKQGLGAIMTAHVHVPSLDSTENRPASLSPVILNNVLKDEYGYGGLLITDALEMDGVRQGYSDGEIAVKALKAGNDILLMPHNLDKAVSAIKNALEEGTITIEQIDEKVKKILVNKYWAGLHEHPTPKEKEDIQNIINKDFHKELIRELYQEALTLLKNENNLLPLGNTSEKKIAVVSVGRRQYASFVEPLKSYIPFSSYHIPAGASMSSFAQMARGLESYDLVITSMHSSSWFPASNYGLSQRAFDFTELVGQKTQNVVVLFGNPYALRRLGSNNNSSAILVAYQNNSYTHRAAANALFGGAPVRGKLPVSIDSVYKAGTGLETKATRLHYRSPLFMQQNKDMLERIDSIAVKGIRHKAYPGCQILVAQGGQIIYHKSFGYHTYNQIRPVENHHLYDLASITKITGATLAVMKLHEKGKLDVDQYMSYYLPQLLNTNKGKIIIREMMAHQARLHPWVPFYRNTLDKSSGALSPMLYRSQPDSVFSLQVAENLYLHNGYRDTIIDAIIDSPLRRNRSYRYSDLGFYLLRYIIEETSGMRMDAYLWQNFYSPMGLQSMTYHPLLRFPKAHIVPTEDDQLFRSQLIHGHVHDPGAAMMGGISGHAGLFSNARDVAAVMQMLLNNGHYGGTHFLDTTTITEFTRRQFPLNRNRRGMGFDKPLPNNQNGGPTTREASGESFGHSGFTGTYAWADPKYDLVYVFLSNRIYPNASNRKLISMGIRTEIQKVLYEMMHSES